MVLGMWLSTARLHRTDLKQALGGRTSCCARERQCRHTNRCILDAHAYGGCTSISYWHTPAGTFILGVLPPAANIVILKPTTGMRDCSSGYCCRGSRQPGMIALAVPILQLMFSG